MHLQNDAFIAKPRLRPARDVVVKKAVDPDPLILGNVNELVEQQTSILGFSQATQFGFRENDGVVERDTQHMAEIQQLRKALRLEHIAKAGFGTRSTTATLAVPRIGSGK